MAKHETLVAALAAFQAELPKLRKDESAKVTGESQSGAKVSYSYGYADLAQVTEVVSVALGKQGLAFTSFPTMGEKSFVLAYALTHESGEERTGEWPLPNPMQAKPQQLGSAITYARRYALMAVTNTFPDKEDDDGASAVPTGHRDQAMTPESFDNLPKERPANRPVSAPPAEPKPQKTSWDDAEVFAYQVKMTTGPVDLAVKGYDWMAQRSLHDRRVPNPADAGAAHYTATETLALRLAHEAALPDNGPADIAQMRGWADARGLLKIQVSPTAALADVLYDAAEQAAHAVAMQAKADTPDPQAE